MSHNLWRCLLEDDVDTFRQYLANATFASGAPRASVGGQVGGAGLRIGSPGNVAASPKTPLKSRKSLGNAPGSATSGKGAGITLTRAEMNTKDSCGRTILHHAASSRSEDALAFVKALLEMPMLDLYAQDIESGWTPLHRALYFGNISIAHALMARDIQDATDYTTNTQRTHAGGLVKIKDHEGNSPFEVFGLTIAPRSIQQDPATLPAGLRDDDSTNGVDYDEERQGDERTKRHVGPMVDLVGDEVYAFGSNKNLSLGVGDGDDRHFPERLHLRRPDHLLRRLLDDHLTARQRTLGSEDLAASMGDIGLQSDIPAVIRYRPITIQNVVMSKLHSAILTNDPISNLYMCGFGRGGRLGTGDENTSFTYQCIQTGGLAKRRISAIALGQDHSVAVCSQGEVYTWGSNRYGQLGYSLPEVPQNEIPMQLTPRQLYGYIKKELIIGAAASAIHSAIFTSTALYTFGKNEGQLGLMDADARSLEMQVLPRRIGVSVLQSPIQSVSAIDCATIVLLESHEVVVFTHYGWTKVLFPLETFTNYYISDPRSAAFNMEANYIQQITSGGNTICARSSYGEVFTVEVPKAENVPANMSTTNPTKARNALPQPARLWSIRKNHMSAIDVAVGQHGSIILCTAAGSVWRKEKRANIKSVREMNSGSARPKDYKFVRIPNLTGAVAVRSNAYGAFAAVRKDCTVTRDQIVPDPPSLWNDVRSLLPFASYGMEETDSTLEVDPSRISRVIINTPSAEQDILNICQKHEPLAQSEYDLWVSSNLTDVRIPVHSFILKARSRLMRSALAEFQETYYYSIPDVLSIEYGQDGQIVVRFLGADFLTIVNLVFYLYTENLIDVWHYTSKALHLAARYRSVRIELMKIATHLELRQLERAVRTMVDPALSLSNDMERAILDPNLFSDADVVVELAEGAELPAHRVLLCVRCPFFDGLFYGRAGGMWVSLRRTAATDMSEAMRVDLKHIDERIFSIVLRHLYADTGEELFDDIVTESLDEFIDIVIELMAAANELMLDRLAQICQQTLGRYINVRNVCSLLNTVAECSVDSFKRAALEYICLNLESMLEMKLLDELDDELFGELDEVVQANQLAYLPFARSERSEAELVEKHPDLVDKIEAGRQRRIDSMRLRSRLVEDEERYAATVKFRVGSLERQASSPVPRSHIPAAAVDSPSSTPSPSPAILAKDSGEDLQFDMDDEVSNLLPSPSVEARRSSHTPSGSCRGRPTAPATPYQFGFGSRGAPQEAIAVSPHSGVEKRSISDASVVASGGFERKAVWQTGATRASRNDLKGIMEQDSATRISNLTEAMKSSSTPSKATTKLSQKERKRQQQLMKQREVKSSESISPSANKTPSSPWQTVPKPPGPGSSPAIPTQSPGPAAARPIPPKQSLTMRQTVAGRSSTPTSPGPGSVGTKQAGPPAGITPSKAPAPQIQSIRHTPLPSRAALAIDARTSMAEILAQQQTEKLAVKEAVAKRSLQEIQQEQEFQEWWDNESRRVQEEEEEAGQATAAAAARRGKEGRGRGGHRRGRGTPRGKAATDTVTETSGPDKPPTTPAALGSGRRGGGQRGGDSRGRARGNAQQRGTKHQ